MEQESNIQQGSAGKVELRTRKINKKILFFSYGKKDPSDGRGFLLEGMSVARSYLLDQDKRDKFENIISELYQKNIDSFSLGRLGKPFHEVRCDYIQYYDQKLKRNLHEKAKNRKYLEFEHKTPRGTNVATLTRFYSLGDTLYLSMDSYVAGSINILKLIIYMVLTLIFGRYAFGFEEYASIRQMGFVMGYGTKFIAFFLVFLLLWWRVIWNVLRAGIVSGFRKAFQKPISDSSLDVDDVSLFLKTVLPVILEDIKGVFNRNGIEIQGLDEEIKNIQNYIVNANLVGNIGGKSNKTIVK